MYSNVNAAPNVNMAPTAVSPAATAPAYGYCAPVAPARGCGDFVLIVVLFILLIIVGAAFIPKC